MRTSQILCSLRIAIIWKDIFLNIGGRGRRDNIGVGERLQDRFKDVLYTTGNVANIL